MSAEERLLQMARRHSYCDRRSLRYGMMNCSKLVGAALQECCEDEVNGLGESEVVARKKLIAA